MRFVDIWFYVSISWHQYTIKGGACFLFALCRRDLTAGQMWFLARNFYYWTFHILEKFTPCDVFSLAGFSRSGDMHITSLHSFMLNADFYFYLFGWALSLGKICKNYQKKWLFNLFSYLFLFLNKKLGLILIWLILITKVW